MNRRRVLSRSAAFAAAFTTLFVIPRSQVPQVNELKEALYSPQDCVWISARVLEDGTVFIMWFNQAEQRWEETHGSQDGLEYINLPVTFGEQVDA